MTEESLNQGNDFISPVQSSRSPTNATQFPLDYDRNLIKSMESILISYPTKEKSNKKQTYHMRRSVTLKDVSDFKFNRKSGPNISIDRIKIAKEKAEEATKSGKVFAVLGPYSHVRQILRNRGWVEKFYYNNDIPNNTTTYKSRSTNKIMDDKNHTPSDGDDLDDDGDDDDIDYYDDTIGDGPNSSGLPPWEEEDGIYGIMSRMLKNVSPNLFWTLRKSQVDYKTLRKDQIINHHGKAGCFTTKTGLAKSLNQLRWFDDKEPDEFFPRCYTISTVEEKHAFIDDYHFTACAGLLKEVIESSTFNQPGDILTVRDLKNLDQSTESTIDKSVSEIGNGKPNKKILPKIRYCERKSESHNSISHKFLDMAIAYCEFILKIKKHEDIDRNDFIFCWSCDWEEFLINYYKVVHEGFKIEGSQHATTIKRCEEISTELRKIFFQFDMEGSRNVWILKPGAKSRGRGIMCYAKLHDVLKLLSNSLVTNETRFIIQKYIERPLLVGNTKFDIRQWFLVTDWNPLTIWWYKDCYLRFCSQQYTLDDLNEAVHLSNNSIQHKYHNGPRSTILPAENMWDWNQFEEWLNTEGHDNAWSTIILPGMKEAVVDALLCVQDSVDWRKNSFELYGADFMVSDGDLKPWLIEINSSPCMAPSTSITARLTSNVLEDIFKVVLDRRESKHCDTGQFELLFKQVQISVPPYIGIDLKLAGISIKNPISTSLLSERRGSTRPITDSIVIRNMKRKDDRSTLRRKMQDNSLATSTIVSNNERTNKSGEIKPSFLHKRSSTSIVVHNDQAKMKYSRKILLPHQRGPTSPLLNKSAKLIINSNKDNSDLIKITHSPVPGIDHDEISEERDLVTKSLVLSNTIDNLDVNPVIIDIDPNFNQNNDKESLDKRKPSSFPTITKYGIMPKSNPTRQYKLPTKVEVVNFSMAKKMMNTSFKEPLSRKKIKQNSHINKSLSSQLFIQKYSLTSFHNFYNSFNKTCKFASSYLLLNEELRLSTKSKTTMSGRIHPKTLKILSKREENNNNIILINLATPVT